LGFSFKKIEPSKNKFSFPENSLCFVLILRMYYVTKWLWERFSAIEGCPLIAVCGIITKTNTATPMPDARYYAHPEDPTDVRKLSQWAKHRDISTDTLRYRVKRHGWETAFYMGEPNRTGRNAEFYPNPSNPTDRRSIKEWAKEWRISKGAVYSCLREKGEWKKVWDYYTGDRPGSTRCKLYSNPNDPTDTRSISQWARSSHFNLSPALLSGRIHRYGWGKTYELGSTHLKDLSPEERRALDEDLPHSFANPHNPSDVRTTYGWAKAFGVPFANLSRYIDRNGWEAASQHYSLCMTDDTP
jgi:hypothetical protein